MIDPRTAPYAATLLRISLGARDIARVALALIPILYAVFLIAASAVQALLGDGRFALGNRLPAPNLRLVNQAAA